MPGAPFLMLDCPVGTGCDEVRFPVHGDWDSRDVWCQRVYEVCNVIVHLVCWLGIVWFIEDKLSWDMSTNLKKKKLILTCLK